MSFNPEFENFCAAWIDKATRPSEYDCFDKYFSLFVAYNRLYAQATFVLAGRGQINLGNRRTFPDTKAATCYVVQYLGASEIITQIDNDASAKDALATLAHLIENEEFYIRLDMVTGNRQREKDVELLGALRSPCNAKRASAILQALYSIRCNMLHGHKGFNEVQCELLRPASVLLGKIVAILREKLRQENYK